VVSGQWAVGTGQRAVALVPTFNCQLTTVN
jgi:hypothetical protein